MTVLAGRSCGPSPVGLVAERDAEHDGEHDEEPSDVPWVADVEPGAAQPPRRERQEPDPRQARPRDRERHGGEREVVEPDDRRDRQRRGDREREAPVTPRRREQEKAADPHRRASRRSPTRRSARAARRACTSPGRSRGRAAGASARSRRWRRRAGAGAATRRRFRRPRARRRTVGATPSQSPSGQTKNFIAVANPTRTPGCESPIARAPGQSEEQAERRCQMRDAHLARDLRPHRDEAVHAPVPQPDDPERSGDAREAEHEHHDVCDAERQHRQRRARGRRRAAARCSWRRPSGRSRVEGTGCAPRASPSPGGRSRGGSPRTARCRRARPPAWLRASARAAPRTARANPPAGARRNARARLRARRRQVAGRPARPTPSRRSATTCPGRSCLSDFGMYRAARLHVSHDPDAGPVSDGVRGVERAGDAVARCAPLPRSSSSCFSRSSSPSAQWSDLTGRFDTYGFDFRGTLWEPAARGARRHDPVPAPGRSSIVTGNPSVYPPLAILALVPLARVDFDVAYVVWSVVLIGAVAGRCGSSGCATGGATRWRCSLRRSCTASSSGTSPSFFSCRWRLPGDGGREPVRAGSRSPRS